ncbi:MAG: peptidylprolyl isomerase [Cyanosarcina radialis HA8281-LM2]|jgi:parvulin-like peptidyl-prolyl isomerase|nr:peptidylprolyl isomerase [Cyanosarcina radialis HA8281-LM2]
MSPTIAITNEDVLHQIKLSRKFPEVVREIVTRHILKKSLAEAGIEVETQELQQEADKFRLLNQLRNADTTWKWLETHHLSLEDFEEIAYVNRIYTKLAEHLFAERVESYFFEHQLDYAGAVIYEVVLDDEDLAIELFYGIQAGEINFYDVAHQYIKDKELRRVKGYRGIVNRQQLNPEISAAVFAANPPQLLKPIVTSKGVHLILVDEIIQAELDIKLRWKIMLDLFAEWLNKQVEEAILVYQEV